jgi:hypothetical protein
MVGCQSEMTYPKYLRVSWRLLKSSYRDDVTPQHAVEAGQDIMSTLTRIATPRYQPRLPPASITFALTMDSAVHFNTTAIMITNLTLFFQPKFVSGHLCVTRSTGESALALE